MKVELQWLCNELISAMVTGGAQGALIVGIVWLALKSLPRTNAATRHGVWFATLLVTALLPAALLIGPLLQKLPVKNDPAPAPPAPDAVYLANAEEPEGFPQAPVEFAIDEAPAPAPIVEAKPGFNWAVSIPKSVSLGCALGWLILAAIRIASLLRQLWILRSIKARANQAPDHLAGAFDEIVAGMRITRRPRLLISEQAAAPMVVGFLHPAMLLPKFVLDRSKTGQLEHLFRHELAHLARRDDWTNLAQQLIAAVLFFHPGILFVSRRLTAEREIACDDHALAIGRAPREYALFLTEFASQMKGRDFTAAPAAWSSNSQLKERIGMILNGKRNASPRVSRGKVAAITAAALGLAVAALVATPRFVVAADEPGITEEKIKLEAGPAIAIEPELHLAIAEPVIAVAPVALPAPARIASAPKVSVQVAPQPVYAAQPAQPPQPAQPRQIGKGPLPVVVAAAPEPAPHPRPKRVPQAENDDDDDDDDLENRLERLERKVEELLKLEKQAGWPKGSMNLNHNFGPEFNAHMKAEMDRAHREVERAHRETERAARGQKVTVEAQARAASQHERTAKMAGRESLKARRLALENQRRNIERELESIEREMEKEKDEKEEKAREKAGKAEEKEEKKARENSDDERPKK